jgi:hypothetical protein
VDDGLRGRGRIVGERVRVGAADDGDVAGAESHRRFTVEPREGVASGHGHERQRRLVLHPHRPRRIHRDAKHEGTLGSGPVEQPGQLVHATDLRRMRMFMS